jgi:murein lipoprotein
MSTVTENDLQTLEDLISDLGKTQKEEFTRLNEKINDMRVDIATLKEGQNGINKRLDNLDFIARTIIASVAITLLAGLAKILYPNLMG